MKQELTSQQADFLEEQARELYFERKAEQENKICECCNRTSQECKEEDRGELREHKIDSSWKSVLICEECFCEIENSQE